MEYKVISDQGRKLIKSALAEIAEEIKAMRLSTAKRLVEMVGKKISGIKNNPKWQKYNEIVSDIPAYKKKLRLIKLEENILLGRLGPVKHSIKKTINKDLDLVGGPVQERFLRMIKLRPKMQSYEKSKRDFNRRIKMIIANEENGTNEKQLKKLISDLFNTKGFRGSIFHRKAIELIKNLTGDDKDISKFRSEPIKRIQEYQVVVRKRKNLTMDEYLSEKLSNEDKVAVKYEIIDSLIDVNLMDVANVKIASLIHDYPDEINSDRFAELANKLGIVVKEPSAEEVNDHKDPIESLAKQAFEPLMRSLSVAKYKIAQDELDTALKKNKMLFNTTYHREIEALIKKAITHALRHVQELIDKKDQRGAMKALSEFGRQQKITNSNKTYYSWVKKIMKMNKDTAGGEFPSH